MALKNQHDACALCGQAVKIGGFTLAGEEGVQKFCCGGCLSIYQLLEDAKPRPPTNHLPVPKDEEKKS